MTIKWNELREKLFDGSTTHQNPDIDELPKLMREYRDTGAINGWLFKNAAGELDCDAGPNLNEIDFSGLEDSENAES